MSTLVHIDTRRRQRLPEFLRKPQTHFASVQELQNQFRHFQLHTVCESARCPNIHECFHRGAAAFMILGGVCTRGCSFCSVPKGSPRAQALPLDPAEPLNVARMAARMGLAYVVITSVNRDDLPDGGAAHFAATLNAVRAALPQARIEALTPDFCGNTRALSLVLDTRPDVLNHNVETAPRLYRKVRPQADYLQSLEVLSFARRRGAALVKSGVMVGLGETEDEINQVLVDLHRAGCSIVTIGQYLQPTRRNLPVAEYVPLDRYERWKLYGEALGLHKVFAGPFVRSSYMADLVMEEAAGRPAGGQL